MRKLYLYFYYGFLGLALFSQIVLTLVTESIWVKRNSTYNQQISEQSLLLAQRKRLETELAQMSSLTKLEQEAAILGYEPINATIVVAAQPKQDSLALRP
ncbi:MAG: hypothetical protein GW947_03010 [Candidatus Pacebacteria bacterium]|nr:hypothetical protein [Candidatus Paceibacterota bacterium]PIR60290.1 MAG: hypothetical protein COU68_02790 [Candidatus Pacebacteria bacterium CG10_big_fil_rev_8_21_14_0_10_45_6]